MNSLMQLYDKFAYQVTRHRGKILAVSTLVIAWRNWLLWQNDQKQLLKGRVESTPATTFTHPPKVSVLVAAWNEGERIEAHLSSFNNLNYPEIELIICAGGTDNTYEQALGYASERIRVLEQKTGEGKQKSLAKCLELATGDIIYLTDADCLYSQDAFIRLLAPLVNDGESITSGTCRPLDQQLSSLLPLYIWASDTFANYHSPDYVEGLLGRNAAVTRTALNEAGGMDFIAPTGTDYQLAKRLLAAGFRIRLVKDSVVPTEYPVDLSVYRKKQNRWHKNLIIYGINFGATNDVRATLKTIGIGSIMVTSLLAGLLFSPFILMLWTLAFSQSVFSKFRYMLFTKQIYNFTIPVKEWISIPIFTLSDFVIWSLPLVDLINRSNRRKW